MQVLIITDFYPNLTYPHEGIFVQRQVAELRKQVDVSVLFPVVRYPNWRRYRGMSRSFAANGNDPQARSFPYRHLPLIGEWLMPRLTAHHLESLLRKAALPFDLIHCHWAYRSGYWGEYLAARFNKKLVVTLHGSDINLWLQQRIKHQRILKVLNRADHLITSSLSLSLKLEEMNIPAAKVTTIYQGIERLSYSPQKRLALRQRWLPQEEKAWVALTIANFYPVKGYDLLLSEIQRMQTAQPQLPLHFFLLGDGAEKARISRAVQNLPLPNRVQLLPPCPPEQLADWLSFADFLVIPSRQEGGPLIAMEALACGLPVVGFRVGFLPEIIHDLNGVLVESGNIQSLAAAIYQVVRQSWSRATIVRDSQRFLVSETVAQILQVYHRLSVA